MKRDPLIPTISAFIAGMFYLTIFVSAVEAACSLSSTSIVFGIYDVLVAAPLDTVGSVVYQCAQNDHNIMITLDTGGAASFATRRMVKGSEQLRYNLYLDAARTVVWGDGTGGTQGLFVHNPQRNNQDIIVPIFGRIPALQDRGVGTYTDTIIVTVNF